MNSVPFGVSVDTPQVRGRLDGTGITLREGEVIKYFHEAAYNIFIVLTNLRFLKSENKKVVSSSELSQIKGVKHTKAGLFSWDKVEVTEKSGRVETFGIYYAAVAAFFTQVLQNEIDKPPKTTERKTESRAAEA